MPDAISEVAYMTAMELRREGVTDKWTVEQSVRKAIVQAQLAKDMEWEAKKDAEWQTLKAKHLKQEENSRCNAPR